MHGRTDVGMKGSIVKTGGKDWGNTCGRMDAGIKAGGRLGNSMERAYLPMQMELRKEGYGRMAFALSGWTIYSTSPCLYYI